MTTSKDANKHLAPTDKEQSAQEDHKQPSKQQNNALKSSSNVGSLLLALIALVLAFYAIYTNLQANQSMKQQEQALLTKINALKQERSDSESQGENAIKAIKESQDKLQNQLSNLDNHLKSSLSQRMYQKNDWLLLKARYCIELAQINAHWSDNLQTTTGLLQQADTLLAYMDEPRVFTIRQAIAKEIAQLEAIPKIDIVGILSRLDAAQSIISHLAIKKTGADAEKNNKASATQKAALGWRESIKENLKRLEKLVVIRRHDEDYLPLPSPEYESMLRESIHITLQETQWAILQNNEAVYQLSLSQAINNINRFFERANPSTQAVIKQLQSLQQIHLVQQQPIFHEQSLPLLNALIQSSNSGEHS